MINPNEPAVMLSKALAIDARNASAAELSAAAEEARSTVPKLDELIASAPAREASALAAARGKPIEAIRTVLKAQADEKQMLEVDRKIAVWLAADLAARARDEANRAEAVARDEARKPLEAETRRVQKHAERAGEYPYLGARVPTLFRTDVVISRVGAAAYSRVPRPAGSYVAYERAFAVPRAIVTEAVLSGTRLPGFWPPRWGNRLLIEGHNYEFEADEAIVGPLRELNKRHDERQLVLSNEIVDRAIAQAHAVLVGEFAKAVAALRELLRLDAEITASDRDARYPDGALIFDPALFPTDWLPGLMSRRVALPSIDGFAQAAE